MNAGKIALAIVGATVLGFVMLIFIAYSYFNGINNTGITHERGLSAQYLDNQNYLSEYISGFYEQIGVAQAQNEALDTILTNAVKGRYDEGGFQVGSSIFTAIVEAYPEAGVDRLLENWGKIQDYIAAKREGFRNIQSKLIDQMRSYDVWRDTGFIKSAVVRTLGFPSNRLEARIDETVLTGEAARQKMLQIVLTPDAKKAYENGEMDPLKVPSPTR